MELIHLLYIALGNLCFMLLDIWHDAYRADKLQISIHHLSDTVVAAIIYFFFNAWMAQVADLTNSELAAILIVVAFTRWPVHDAGLNLVRGKPLNYLGEGDHDTALTDKFLSSLDVDPWLVRGSLWVLSFIMAFVIINLN